MGESAARASPTWLASLQEIDNETRPFLLKKTIYVVVVNPSVGTEHQAIILRTPSADFVVPDNGVLSYVLQQCKLGSIDEKSRKCLRNHWVPL